MATVERSAEKKVTKLAHKMGVTVDVKAVAKNLLALMKPVKKKAPVKKVVKKTVRRKA